MSTQLSAHTQKIRDPFPALLQEYGVKLKHRSRRGNISRFFFSESIRQYLTSCSRLREMSVALFTGSEQEVPLNLDTKRKRNVMKNSLRLYEQNSHKSVYLLRIFTST